MKKSIKYLVGATTASFLIGCGGGGSSGSNTSSNTTTTAPTTPTVSTTLTVVDPYIVGATVFWDKNNNGIKDSNEPISTASNALGQAVISTDVAIPEGEILIMSTKGTHGGTAYTGTLKAKHNVNGVISPLTTLEVAGFTKDEIVSLLGNSITAEDITKNPMETITSTIITVDENDIKLIKANMAVNTFLNINGFNASKNTLQTNSSDLDKSLNLMNILIESTNVASSNALNAVNSALTFTNYALNKNTNDEKRSSIDDFVLNTNGFRDSCFGSLLTNTSVSENCTMLTDEETPSTTYNIDNYISDLQNKTWLSLEYGNSINNKYSDNYMSFYSSPIFYQYSDSREMPYPNEEEPIFNSSLEKIDDTHYRKYLNNLPLDICEVFSYNKVTNILGINVDAIEVNEKCSYEYSGNEDEWEKESYYGSSFSNISAFKDYLISSQRGIGEEGSTLKDDGKIYRDNILLENSSWYIEGDILKINYYDEIWIKIIDGVPYSFWRADSGYTYIGVTKTQSDAITNVIDPNIISVSSGFKANYLNNKTFYTAVKWDFWVATDDRFSNGNLSHTNTPDGNFTETYEILSNGTIKVTTDEGYFIWTINTITPNYIKVDSSDMINNYGYFFFDSDKRNTKLSQLNGN